MDASIKALQYQTGKEVYTPPHASMACCCLCSQCGTQQCHLLAVKAKPITTSDIALQGCWCLLSCIASLLLGHFPFYIKCLFAHSASHCMLPAGAEAV